jgi:hypothetical protein
VSTGTEAGVPASAGVELADQSEEASGGCLEVRRQLGDFVTESIHLSGRCGGNQSGFSIQRVMMHGGSLSERTTYVRQYTSFSDPPASLQEAQFLESNDFW